MMACLNEIAAQFQLVKLQITVQLKQNTQLPAFKGAMWHGLFGEALKAYDEQCFQVFYGDHDRQQPKPYAIAPEGDHKVDWYNGELLTLELTLFGDACQLVNEVVDAWREASCNTELGIGEKRASFGLLSVSSITPYGIKPGIHPHTLHDWLNLNLNVHADQKKEVALHFLTPLRVKQNSNIVRKQAPELKFWVNQSLRRLTQLGRFWVNDNEELFDRVYQQTLESIPNNVDWQSHCYFEDWTRYSHRHGKVLPIGGLKGQVSFYGELETLIPILKIGELLQVGGKTTFGLGKYRLIA